MIAKRVTRNASGQARVGPEPVNEGLSDPLMQDALHDVPLYREFAGLGDGASCLPDY